MTKGKNPRQYLGVFAQHPPDTIRAARAPTSADKAFAFNTIWIDTVTDISYQLTNITSGLAVWTLLGPGSSDVDVLTGDSGGPIAPAGGNITLAGGTNIETTGAGSTITFDLDDAIDLATSVTSPLYTVGAATDMAIDAAAGQDILITMGDAAGANKVSFLDSAAVEVASIDSNGGFSMGAITFSGLLTASASATIDTAGTALNLATDNSADAVNLAIGTQARDVNIANSAAAHTVEIGSTTGAASLVLNAGTGNFVLNGATATTIAVGTGLTTGTVTIGATGNTGTMTISPSTGAQTVNIANADGVKTINVGSGVSGNTISVGNGINTGAQIINVAGGASAADSTVNVLSGNGSAGTQTCNVLTGTRAGALNLATGAAAHVIAVGSASAGAVTVDTAAGISLDSATTSNFTVTGAGADLNLLAVGGSVLVESTEDAALAVYLHANGGTSETIRLRADQGTGVASVDLLSDVGGVTITGGLGTADAVNIVASNAAGGIDIDAGTGGIIADTTGAISLDSAAASNFTATGAGIDLTLASAGGSVLVSSTEDAALAIRLYANGGTSETIQLHADQGTGVGSVNLLSDVGGITLRATGLASADAINLEAPAGGIDADAALQINVASSQAAATAIQLTASDAAGGITATVGTGKFNIAGNLNLSSVATQLQMNGGAVTDFIGQATLINGQVTVNNTNIAATDRIFLTRSAINASTALGMPLTTISAGASFTIEAKDLATPGNDETGDLSTFDYFIVRQL